MNYHPRAALKKCRETKFYLQSVGEPLVDSPTPQRDEWIGTVSKGVLNANDAKNANSRKYHIVYNQRYTKLFYSLICANLRFLRHLRSFKTTPNHDL